jgi:hypothetical protein
MNDDPNDFQSRLQREGIIDEKYYFWKAPADGLPEFTSGGHGVCVIPGLGNFVLLDVDFRGSVPEGAIAASAVRKFLENATTKQRVLSQL